jgi:acetyl esterase/lipase
MKKMLFLFLLAGFISCQKEDDKDPVVTVSSKTLTEVAYGTDPAQTMDIYLPAGRSADTTKLIILIHGGGWMSGDKSEFTPYIPRLQQIFPGFAFVNVNYRLASISGNFFPTQENDVKAAIDLLLMNRTSYLFSDKLILFGASAGGHLSALQAYKYSSPKIKVVVDMFGPADMADLYNSSNFQTQSAMQILMNGTPTSNPAIYQNSSPINFVTSQSPPTIILHGDQDILVDLSQSVELKNTLKAAGVPVQLDIFSGMGHELWPEPIMDQAFLKIRNFVYTHVP